MQMLVDKGVERDDIQSVRQHVLDQQLKGESLGR